MRHALNTLLAILLLSTPVSTTTSQEVDDCPILNNLRASVETLDPSYLVLRDENTIYSISIVLLNDIHVFNLGIVHTRTGSKIAPETVFVEHTGDCRVDYVDGLYGSFTATDADQQEFMRRLRLLQSLSPEI